MMATCAHDATHTSRHALRRFIELIVQSCINGLRNAVHRLLALAVSLTSLQIFFITCTSVKHSSFKQQQLHLCLLLAFMGQRLR